MGSLLFPPGTGGVLEWVLRLTLGASGLCILALVALMIVSWSLERN